MSDYQSEAPLKIKLFCFLTCSLTDLPLWNYIVVCFLQMLSYLLSQLMESFEVEATRSSIMAVEVRKVV